MLIWQRSLKAYHCATGVSTVDPGLIFKLVTILISFGLPFVLTFVLGAPLFNPDVVVFTATDVEVSDAVLILRNLQETQVLHRTQYGDWENFGKSASFANVASSVQMHNDITEVSIDVAMETNEFELYLYLTTNHTDTPQLLYHRRASAKPIRTITFATKVDLVGHSDDNEVLEYTPSSLGNMWQPGQAIKQHMKQSIRLDKKTSVVRHVEHAYPNEQTFAINVLIDHSRLAISREEKWTIYAFTVEYIYFAVFLFTAMSLAGDILFQSGGLKSHVKLQH